MKRDLDRLGSGEIAHLASVVQQGKASTIDAKLLLAEFVACAGRRRGVPAELLEHFSVAFRRFLEGECSIETALGLKRVGRGRPEAGEKDRVLIATSVLEYRLQGRTLEGAAALVASDLKKGQTQIREAWRRHKQDALTLVRLNRALHEKGVTEDELRRLRRIFPKPRG